MPETLVPDAAMAARKGLLARFFGVLTSPRQTYADIAQRPAWLGMFLLVVVVSAACGGWLTSTAVGRRAVLEKTEEGMRATEKLGVRIPDDRRAAVLDQVRTKPDWRMYSDAFVGTLVFVPIVCAVIAGILLGVFNAVLGGDAKFKQVYAVVMFSQAVVIVERLFKAPLNYALESLNNPTTFGALLPMLDDKSVIKAMLGSIDFFTLWWLVSLSIGLGVLYKRPTRGIAISLIGIYVVLAVTIAAGIALITG